jgi:acyl carrier protein
VLTAVRAIVGPAAPVELDTALEQLDLDSLDREEIAHAIEQDSGQVVDPGALARAQTISDLVGLAAAAVAD